MQPRMWTFTDTDTDTDADTHIDRQVHTAYIEG